MEYVSHIKSILGFVSQHRQGLLTTSTMVVGSVQVSIHCALFMHSFGLISQISTV